jgi:hypothetical protein
LAKSSIDAGPGSPDRAQGARRHAAEGGALEPARIHQAARRVRRFMQRFVR